MMTLPCSIRKQLLKNQNVLLSWRPVKITTSKHEWSIICYNRTVHSIWTSVLNNIILTKLSTVVNHARQNVTVYFDTFSSRNTQNSCQIGIWNKPFGLEQHKKHQSYNNIYDMLQGKGIFIVSNNRQFKYFKSYIPTLSIKLLCKKKFFENCNV